MKRLKGPFKIRLEISGPEGLSRWEDIVLPYLEGPYVNNTPLWNVNIVILRDRLADQMRFEFNDE